MITSENTMPNNQGSFNTDPFIIDVSGHLESRIDFGNEDFVSGNIPQDQSQSSHPDSWKIGKKYSRKLNLNEDQSAMLDTMSFSGNVFNEIEYCKIQIIKQFLRSIEYLYQNCIPVNKSYPTVIEELSEIIVCLRYNYRKDSLNYNYTYNSVQTEIFNHILKLSENNVREVYGIKRKINTDFIYTEEEILYHYNKKIVSKLDAFLSENQHQILDADYKTNIILNENNTSRWKTKFEMIRNDYSNSLAFEREIFRLSDVNIKNPSIDALFFEASKFVAEYDKNCALRLYIHYLEKDLSSPKFDKRELPKNVQKNLFSTSELFTDFENILNEFISDRNMEIALEKISQFYLPKRKRIKIDTEVIKNIQAQHSETADILGQILNDDSGEEMISIQQTEIADEKELTITAIPHLSEIQVSKYMDDLHLTEIQKDIIDLFEKHSFNILQEELQDFIKAKGMFMGSTIDSINECCFELLDDILIEEEEEYFIINTNYYKKLLKND
ncbi:MULTISPECIES: tellurite resistance TerB C-terminal domain-containing protein [unclassified Chryseobacterium]|uniref:tellurite resistance TerB C-terminal domain-containing protein n=1 Tax=unclassified Chryseobacterium TaxID=2593645 RepID=UPI0028532ACC|nr:tellurite resistance TerB C-terminal domain-containing protein [Chryseobacterium sp. CFS7]MDR4892011.1 tellurite resistance TerB C-terminal domain-containing protein [Chryseobacterium sp. CFS7]